MKRKMLSLLLASVAATVLMVGCGSAEQPVETIAPEATPEVVEEVAEEVPEAEAIEEPVVEEVTDEVEETEAEKAVLEDGVYQAKFDTDSGMFHVNEACNGMGTLTVKDGEMTIHISLVSKKIKNLYLGLAEDAQKEGAVLLEPTIDTVDYEDGTSDEVHGFDVPVPALDEEFDLALIGEKGVWYDHKVSVASPEVSEEQTEAEIDMNEIFAEERVFDGEYTVDVVLEGGSGKATVESPCSITAKDGVYTATITWSSPNYDFMMIGEEKYLPVNTEGNSVFEIPVSVFDQPMEVQADTVAMSKPHLIDYTLTFNSASMQAK